jgi:hypothetical protein
MSVTYCDVCGDYLFKGQHRGHVEVWCRETISNRARETIIPTASRNTVETINPPIGETIIRRGRPRKEAIDETITAAKPWIAAGLSRATWYRRQRDVLSLA